MLLLLLTLVAFASCKPTGDTENVMTENQHLYQGDMIFPEGEDAVETLKNANIKTKKWPNGVIPYAIDPASGFTANEITTITNSMRLIESQTSNCLQFVQRTTQTAYLMIRSTNTGCNSYVGQISSQPQQLSLQRPGCVAQTVVAHELLHAAGFEHEHSRPDRDNFIEIIWSNVQDGMNYAFDKLTTAQVSTLNQPYDLYSIMHYRLNAFTKNGQNTIAIRLSSINPLEIGDRPRLSDTDVKKVKAFYGCQ